MTAIGMIALTHSIMNEILNKKYQFVMRTRSKQTFVEASFLRICLFCRLPLPLRSGKKLFETTFPYENFLSEKHGKIIFVHFEVEGNFFLMLLTYKLIL
jgi:hypothetical protein